VSAHALPVEVPVPGEVYLGRELIADRVAELGAAISRDYRGRELVLLTVLKGAVVFFADLSRAISIPHRLEFMAFSSYRGGSGGQHERIRLLKDLDRPVRDAHVVIVEDAIDTGLTLHSLGQTLRFRGPASIEVCTLLDRPYRRLVDCPVRYSGFTALDQFVVGYGFDYRQQFRDLPDIHVLQMP
jgi:hypoxanthine phosphoribosyltransferase